MKSRLSVIIPVYNEKRTIEEIVKRVLAAPIDVEKELIIVDDGSIDGTRGILEQYKQMHRVIFHDRNRGKGSAIRTGLSEATGEYVVIQDGDLEYDPEDFGPMLEMMKKKNLNVLYGSRQLNPKNTWHSGAVYFWGGLSLTWITNILYRQHLTDEPTCYKMFRTEFLKSLPLRCERFEFCPEVTALSVKKGERILEIPISYSPRKVHEGKKIRLKDWFEAVWTLLRYRF